ncbi:ESX secretion-associated protein EspG [Rhodococcus spongiicola]|uniref:ESX secretion-associated protein EspG n=1 Tax=Rhodococcus spongiicola TaxID=2487352 RepID=A0A438AXE8_9NOCA|nr:ESX secretion-associated protein EspG [Rhodococcus spongiicola]RVW03365.1 ESX secretion-associated protein EspG [Rhodococcus spongiicola]
MNGQLSSAQFMHLWEATDLDRMPHPFEHRTEARLESELYVERQRLDRWRSEQPVHQLREAVGVLRHPEVSVSVYSPGATPVLRRGAIRRGVTVVADQLPATTGTGDLRIQIRPASRAPDVRQFARDLLHELPEVPAGRTSAVDVYPDDLRANDPQAESGGNGVLHNATIAGAPLLKRILARRTAAGYICLHRPWQGAYDPILDSMTWFDVAGDGRYLYYTDHLVRLRSATTAVLVDKLEERVRKALVDTGTDSRPPSGTGHNWLLR